jgi:hypothetical protein
LGKLFVPVLHGKLGCITMGDKCCSLLKRCVDS